MPAESAILRKLQVWKTKLLDLSHGNRLLFYKPTKSSSTTVTYPEPEDLLQQLLDPKDVYAPTSPTKHSVC